MASIWLRYGFDLALRRIIPKLSGSHQEIFKGVLNLDGGPFFCYWIFKLKIETKVKLILSCSETYKFPVIF